MSKSSKRPAPPIPLDILKKLHKVDLHRHLDGSIRVSTVIELAKEQKIDLPSFKEAELKKLIEADEKTGSLVEYLRGFGITLKVLQRPYAITRAVFEVAEDAELDGVKYLEIRFAPVLHTQLGLSLSAVMEAAVEGKEMAERNIPITVRLIVAGMRQMNPEESEKMAEIAWRYRDKGAVGFDLAGPEAGFMAKKHKPALDLCRRQCLNLTLHAGEADGWESVQDAVQYCGATRIGHGVRLQDNPSLLQFVVNKRITVECCMTSNIHTSAIKKYSEHPMRKYFDAGVLVVPCVDNATVSHVTVSEEFAAYQKQFDFNVEEIVRLTDYGFRSAFLEGAAKRRLRADALRHNFDTLKDAGFDVSGVLANTRYYDPIGVDLLDDCTGHYWAGTVNPPITLDLIRKLPKADLDCRLDGSISLPLLWEELQKAKVDTAAILGREKPIASLDELKAIVQPPVHTTATGETAKQLFLSVLQTKDQIERAIDDIVTTAAADAVSYIELVVRLKTHTAGKLSKEDVLKTVLDCRKKALSKGLLKWMGVIVGTGTVGCDPIRFRESADLAIKYQSKGVVGFGCYGADISSDALVYFQSTLEKLREANVNVVISAGRENPESISAAIFEGGASRVSGAYTLHKDPALLSYVSEHKIPVEMGSTDQLNSKMRDVTTFAGNPIRMYLDMDLQVNLVSLRFSLYPSTRSEIILRLVQECSLTIADVCTILSLGGFVKNFQPHSVREEMTSQFWKDTRAVLDPAGFKHLRKKYWFRGPTSQVKSAKHRASSSKRS